MAYDEELAARIRALLADDERISEMRMFGGLAFLLAGNMAVAASGQGGLMVRVDPERTEELLAEPGAHPFEMRGRALDGWLRVEPAGLGSDDELRRWVERGVDYARTLPPKPGS